MSDMRTMIRQILLEELENKVSISDHGSHIEMISINNSDDLHAFALRVLDTAKTRDLKTDLQSGKLKFALESGKGGSSRAASPQRSLITDSVAIQKGLVTEKDIARLASDTNSLSVGKNVFFTPLAKDEIRRRGLKIERNSQ